MDVVCERSCGLDVHKRTAVACIITREGKETRTFGTVTKELLALADWLMERKVSHVAMESTGVFWKSIYNLLEGMEFKVLVANAQHIKAVPGRKTDVKDTEWIADLLRHGLLRASYIPDRPHRELRELARYRRSLVQQRAKVVNQIHKVLEGANIKLGSVVSDVVGISGRAMLEAVVSGTDDPHILASLAKGRMRSKRAVLEEALQGSVRLNQRFLMSSQLRHLDFLDQEIGELDTKIAELVRPFEEAVQRLDGIPGVGRRTAEEVIIEVGEDVSRFPTSSNLASWARMCPSNNESAGKHKPGHTGHANRWLRSALVEAAWGAARTRNTYLSAQYKRLVVRRGKKRAIVAVAHSILVIVYSLLRTGGTYKELGGNYFDDRNRQGTIRRAVRRIERLGYTITLAPA